MISQILILELVKFVLELILAGMSHLEAVTKTAQKFGIDPAFLRKHLPKK